MDVADFLEHLEELFDMDPGTLNIASIVEEAPGWSSLTFLGLIALIDEKYNVSISPRQIHKCVTVGDLYSVVSRLRVATSAA